MKIRTNNLIDIFGMAIIVIVAALTVRVLYLNQDIVEPHNESSVIENSEELAPTPESEFTYESSEDEAVSEIDISDIFEESDANDSLSEELSREIMGVHPDAPETSYEYIAEKYKEEILILARLVNGEAGTVKSRTQQACVIWTAINIAERDRKPLKDVASNHNCFHGYDEKNDVVDYWGRDLTWLAYDVLVRYERELNGETDCGRVLPKDYYSFHGKNGINYFRHDTNDHDINNSWDYSLPSPYED